LLPIPMLDGGQIAVLASKVFSRLFGLTLSMANQGKNSAGRSSRYFAADGRRFSTTFRGFSEGNCFKKR
jgi:membrane-associated protease RseP (regulator of RpoE activity)